jgi:hypothetical protein
MITPLQLDAAWRDYWGGYNPPAAAQMQPLELSDCYRPRLVLLPDALNQIVPQSGKIEYSFTLKPGSLIWGMLLSPVGASTLQLTDVNMGHKFFQQPVQEALLTLQQSPGLGSPVVVTDFPRYLLFPCPHPVVGDGLFMFEAWTTIGIRVQIILLVAEVYECQ